MNVLNRYILRQLIVGFVLVIISMTILVWLTQSLRLLDLIINNGASVRIFLYMTMLVMPAFIQVMIPLALFAVVLFVFIRMQSDKELIVMQASGMSPMQIARPVLIFAGMMVAAGYLFTLVLTPAASLEWREVRFKVRNDLSHLLFQEGQFNSIRKGLTLFIRDRMPSGDVAGVFVYDAQNPKKKSVLAAETGTIYQQDDGFALVFKNGTRQEYNAETRKFSLLKFEKYTMNFGSKSSPQQLLAGEPREYNLKRLWAATPQTEKNMAHYRKARVELVKRLLYPLYAVSFALIALFGVLKGFYNRRGNNQRVNFVIFITLAIQSLSLFFENLSGKNLAFVSLMFLNVALPLAVFYFLTLHAKKTKAAAMILIFCCLAGTPAWASQSMVKINPVIHPKQPVDFEADTISYDKNTGALVAKGHVVLRQDGTVLKTEKIIYNRGKNTISIPTAAEMILSDGTQVHVTEAMLTDGMRRTLAEKMTVRLIDGTQITAQGLLRDNKQQDFTVTRASYSPCEECNGRRFWALSAQTIQRDTASETMTFKHAFFEFENVPVLYMPYFMMPDYTVKRKSGFLAPSLSSDRTIQGGITTPFFFALAPNQNFVLRPTFSATHQPLLVGDYAGRFAQGFVNLQASATRDNDGVNQGHIRSTFGYDMTDKWRLAGQVFRVKEDTYFRRYDIPRVNENLPFLTSTMSAERFGEQNHLSLAGYSFQNLRFDVDNDTIPAVIPTLHYRHMTLPLTSFGATAWTEIQGASFMTDQDFRSHRLSLTQGVRVPYTHASGVVVDTSAFIRADGYQVDAGPHQFGGQAPDSSYVTGRVFPVGAVEMSYPLMNAGGEMRQVFEPIMMFVASPTNMNKRDIPNVDSLNFNFDNTNLFSVNRFSGYDQVETGTRANYGAKWSLYNRGNQRIVSALFGQSYRMEQSDELTRLMGYEDHFSDYVGQVQIDHRNISAGYRFRLSSNDFSHRKNELFINGGSDPLRLGLGYTMTKEYRIQNNAYPEREEIYLTLGSQLSRRFSVKGFYRYDLSDDGGPIEAGVVGKYENECTALIIDTRQAFTSDRDYRGGFSIRFQFVLKTLGGT